MPVEVQVALIAGFFGLMGGLAVTPINAIISMFLKKEEIRYQNQLNDISKERELLYQHQLEMAKLGDTSKITGLEKRIEKLESIGHGH